MISFEVWNNQIQRLKAAFGEKYLSGGREHLLRERVLTLNDSEFENLIDQVLMSKNHGPTVVEILNIAEPIKQASLQRERERNQFERFEQSSCEDCKGTGVIEAVEILRTKNSTPYSFAFGCPNRNCRQAIANLPRWDDHRYASRYERVRPGELLPTAIDRASRLN